MKRYQLLMAIVLVMTVVTSFRCCAQPYGIGPVWYGQLIFYNTNNIFYGDGSHLTGGGSGNTNGLVSTNYPLTVWLAGGFITNLTVINIQSNNAAMLDNSTFYGSGLITSGTGFSGDGHLLTSLTGANVTGTVPNATTAVNFSGNLAGDVTGPQGTTAVAFVGGKTAAAVASSVTTVNAAATVDTPSTLVLRDGSGNFNAGTITLAAIGASNTINAVTFTGGSGAVSNEWDATTGKVGALTVSNASTLASITGTSTAIWTNTANAVGFKLMNGISSTNMWESWSNTVMVCNLSTNGALYFQGYCMSNNGGALAFKSGTGNTVSMSANGGLTTTGGITGGGQISSGASGFNTSFTITGSGTTGNQTINKPSGSIRVAAAGTSVVLTDSVITANSVVLANVATHDATAWAVQVVPVSGSCTFYFNAACTAETEIRWTVATQ